jgi:hypothetical protein
MTRQCPMRVVALIDGYGKIVWATFPAKQSGHKCDSKASYSNSLDARNVWLEG